MRAAHSLFASAIKGCLPVVTAVICCYACHAAMLRLLPRCHAMLKVIKHIFNIIQSHICPTPAASCQACLMSPFSFKTRSVYCQGSIFRPAACTVCCQARPGHTGLPAAARPASSLLPMFWPGQWSLPLSRCSHTMHSHVIFTVSHALPRNAHEDQMDGRIEVWALCCLLTALILSRPACQANACHHHWSGWIA